MKKLICFDMDGTLLSHTTYKISDAVVEGIDCLKRKGHIVVIASGRDMEHEFSSFLAEIIKPDAIVHCNGQKVTVGTKPIYEVLLDQELIRRLIQFADKKGICIGTNIGEKGCFVNEGIAKEMEERVFGRSKREFLPKEELLKIPLHALGMYGTPEQARQIEDYFPELKLPLFASREGADIIYKDTSKAKGIQVLLEHYGMNWQDVVAFGDSMNDIEMIQEAGIGVVMGNGLEILKESADFVTKTVNEDGVLYGLQQIGLL